MLEVTMVFIVVNQERRSGQYENPWARGRRNTYLFGNYLNPTMLCSSFGRLCFARLTHGARRSVPLTLRLEWQDERRCFCFPPPVGAPFIVAASRARGPAHISGYS